MPRLRTTASRWAAAAMLALGILFVQRLATSTTPVYSILSGVLAVAAVLSGVKMLAHNCFESHLVAALVVAATATSTLLVLTVGMPGGGSADFSVVHVGLLALSVVVPLLLLQDGRVRREHARRTRRPYAR